METSAFLKQVCRESRNNLYLFDQHPEFESVQSRFIDLYSEIISIGLENEKHSHPDVG